ncbi:MAG: hypothetical protein Q7S58_19500 [Candidatus Binatus sp.]|uniref:hypothetical protein n=1 Tax=Candidatus Binatus sp. TaxID=2811406 RepID=UPI00271A92AC|nr:hypothetical protein [Candidatus Binatus sp.]MDO8434588.1 hypothetical protein [Candidatus Binatus sp.]
MGIVATGFADAAKRADHFQAHGRDCGTATATEYEQMAIGFLNAALVVTMVECVRLGNGDTIRYDRATDFFAVMRPDGVIKTFYKPERSWHGFSGNLRYFQVECGK